MEKKNNTLIKIIVVLGSLAAIFLALAVIYKKYNKNKITKDSDPFDFDDDFFFDDCEGCCDDDCFDEEVSEDDILTFDAEDDEAEEGLAF